jgi:hypothetical protein
MDQVLECFMDPKTYFFAAISVLTQVSSDDSLTLTSR